MSTETQKVVLRNINASTDARYIAADMRAELVERKDAMTFRSEQSAQRFLSRNSEFKGYRVEVVS